MAYSSLLSALFGPGLFEGPDYSLNPLSADLAERIVSAQTLAQLQQNAYNAKMGESLAQQQRQAIPHKAKAADPNIIDAEFRELTPTELLPPPPKLLPPPKEST